MKIENGVLLSVLKEDLEFDKSFVVPKTVKKIGKKAFYKVPTMRFIEFHPDIEEIDVNAFSENSELIRTNIIPNENIDANTFVKCQNLKCIDVDGCIPFIPKYINKLIISNKVNTIQFNWMDKMVLYKMNDKSDLIELKKVQKDRFIINFFNTDENCIFDYNFVCKYDFNDFKDYTKEDEKDFKKMYRTVYSDRIDLFYDWSILIRECLGNRKVEFPPENVMLSLPNIRKAVYEYYNREKKWKDFSKKYLGDIRRDVEIGVTKLCYALGYFCGNQDIHEIVEEFVKQNREKIINNEVGLLFHKLDFKQEEFDLNFAIFVRQDWSNICNAYSWDVEKFDYLENTMKDIYANFKEIKQYAHQNKLDITFDMCRKYLSLRALETRKGNEELYKEVKKYHFDYSRLDYDNMQDLYEQAQDDMIEYNKQVKVTKDNIVDDTVKYEWLKAADPVNFILGNKVGCCARINDVGSGILKASVLSEDARNLVFRDRTSKIIGKATAYFNIKKKYIVFNTLYTVQNTTETEKFDILDALRRAVIDQVEVQNKDGETKLSKVAIGMSNNAIAHQIQMSKIKVKHDRLLKNRVFESIWAGVNYRGDANSTSGQAILYSMPRENTKK